MGLVDAKMSHERPRFDRVRSRATVAPIGVMNEDETAIVEDRTSCN
jgi:hypothetical protein